MIRSLGLLLVGAGVLCIWSAVVNVSPVDEVRAALGGGPKPTKGGTGGANFPAGGGTGGANFH